MLFSSLLALLPLSFAATIPERRSQTTPNELQSLSKRAFTGRATFYDVGLGACGQYNVASDFIVALNSAQYGGGYPGPNCFKSITIWYGGKSAQATIMDQCPSCGYGDLDFSRSLFNYFASESMGVFQMSWEFNDGSQQQQPQQTSTTPTSTYTPPTSTYTPPTSTYTPPTSTSTQQPTTSSPGSSSSSSSDSSSGSSSGSSSSSGLNVGIISSVSVSATTISGSVVPISQATGSVSSPSNGGEFGNLALLNQAVTNYGNILVINAQR